MSARAPLYAPTTLAPSACCQAPQILRTTPTGRRHYLCDACRKVTGAPAAGTPPATAPSEAPAGAPTVYLGGMRQDDGLWWDRALDRVRRAFTDPSTGAIAEGYHDCLAEWLEAGAPRDVAATLAILGRHVHVAGH